MVLANRPRASVAPVSVSSNATGPSLVHLQPEPPGERRLIPPKLKQISRTWRVVLITVGVVVFGLGALIWASPMPGGFILLAVGLSLVLTHSQLAKRRFLTWKRRHPQLLMPLRGLLRRFSRRRPRP